MEENNPTPQWKGFEMVRSTLYAAVRTIGPMSSTEQLDYLLYDNKITPSTTPPEHWRNIDNVQMAIDSFDDFDGWLNTDWRGLD